MKYKSIYTSSSSIQDAVQDVKKQLEGFKPELLMFFSSSKYAPNELSKAFKIAFPKTITFGCSSSGELSNDQVLKNSISVMAFGKGVFKNCFFELIDLNEPKQAIEAAFERFEKKLNRSMNELEYDKFFGLTLIDGLSGKEEVINERINDLTNIIFIGGSAGDDLNFENTFIYYNGEAHSNKALLAIFEPHDQFSFIKTQSFVPTGKTLTATQVNIEKREAIEFDNKPAVQAYSEALGVNSDALSDHLFMNPIGLMTITNEPFVRSPQRVSGESIKFYCRIQEGLEYAVLKSTDIIEDTRKAIEDKQKELSGISAIINFNCILRTLELEKKGITKEYGLLFNGIPTTGFSTYGESFIGHINQTATMLVLK